MLESYFTECKFDMGQSGSTANAKYEFNAASYKLLFWERFFFVCLWKDHNKFSRATRDHKFKVFWLNFSLDFFKRSLETKP